MYSGSVNQTAAVPPMPYQAPAQSTNPPEKDKKTGIIDEMLAELTNIITTGVQNQDTRSGEAVLGYLNGEAGSADALPPKLVKLLDEVLGTAASAGKAEEFKALLGEYVAIQWALSTLNELIRKQQAGQIDADALADKLQARAFLKQMEAAIVGRMDSQGWYSDWRALFEESFAPLLENPNLAALEADLAGADVVSTVETLLQAAPRPDLSAVAA